MGNWPDREADSRRERLQQLMRAQGMDGCLISQNVGIYYFTGSMQTGYLFVPSVGEASFYVRRSLLRARAESKVRTEDLGSFRQFGARLAADYPALFAKEHPSIGADLDVMPAQLYLKLREIVPNAHWADASAMLRRVRTVKSPYEADRIRAAAQVAAHALDEGLTELKEGMTELSLIAVIEYAIRRQGHVGLMRMRGYNQEIMTGMVAAGAASAEPSYFDGPAGGRGLTPAAPQSASYRPIRRDEPILLDIGCCIDGYVIDQTRAAVIGSLPRDLEQAYEAAVHILRRTESRLKPGAVPEQLYAEALEMAAEAGLSAHFMGFGADQVRFLGHGIGLEIDEWPVLARGFAEPLEAGMVIAVEPKFTFPGRGVVGIENTYLITENGFETLTVSPEKLFKV